MTSNEIITLEDVDTKIRYVTSMHQLGSRSKFKTLNFDPFFTFTNYGRGSVDLTDIINSSKVPETKLTNFVNLQDLRNSFCLKSAWIVLKILQVLNRFLFQAKKSFHGVVLLLVRGSLQHGWEPPALKEWAGAQYICRDGGQAHELGLKRNCKWALTCRSISLWYFKTRKP